MEINSKTFVTLKFNVDSEKEQAAQKVEKYLNQGYKLSKGIKQDDYYLGQTVYPDRTTEIILSKVTEPNLISVPESHHPGGMPSKLETIYINGMQVSLSVKDMQILVSELDERIGENLTKTNEIYEKYWLNKKDFFNDVIKTYKEKFWDENEILKNDVNMQDVEDFLFSIEDKLELY